MTFSRLTTILVLLCGASTYAAAQTNVPMTDCSGAIASGGVAQTLIPASGGLHGFCVMNLSTSNVMWISFTATAAATTAGSFALNPGSSTSAGGSFCSPVGMGTRQAVSIISSGTDTFSCTKW